MLNKLFNLFERASPRLAEEVREARYTLRGWRFNDLMRHQEDVLSRMPTNQASIDHSLAVLRTRQLSGPRLAFISNMPPDTTGIASCSFYTWQGSELPVDIFCPVTDTDWFFANELRLRAGGREGTYLFDAGTFLTADCLHRYAAIVIALGNSGHNVYIHDMLRKAGELDGDLNRVCLYVHDPVLLHLVERGTGLTGAALIDALVRIKAKHGPVTNANQIDARRVHESLADAGYCGASYFADLGVKRFLVNSNAAAEILRHDMEAMGGSIETLFHPVFLPSGIQRTRPVSKTPDAPLVVGSFGYAGSSKRTELLVAAVHELQREGINVRLLLAGFGTAYYADVHATMLAGIALDVRDAPTDRQLCEAMLEVDVAVQLRATNRGESSGIVPQLIALGQRTIVSDIGAFREYGGAVQKVPEQVTASELAKAVLAAAIAPAPEEAMRNYAQNHSPARFRSRLLETLGIRLERPAPSATCLPLPIDQPLIPSSEFE
ncbi:glycosyltransferase family protein [Acidocella aromatica]|uniref:Glycosyltransferase n=1 Tax=Acidocella aromatica TaxID=1303579 RepID=A0A840VF49_9PROT|nr:hypothetical protein [Acidocella aromatica]MBB5374316.1 hypothetical protein [Acidocella aromatica]